MSSDARHDHLVGILGGMGPAATAEFYAKLVRRTPASRDQDHLRVAIWADPTVPDRVAAAINGSDEPYPAMLHGALQLRAIGATVIVVPCHTAHVFLPKLAADTGLRFLDMVRETVRQLAGDRPRGGVGLLGTRGTIRSGLYQAGFRGAGLDVTVADDPAQERLDLAIALVKQGAVEAAGRQLQIVLDALAAHGAAPVVLACTEIPLAVPYLPVPAQVELLDPTDLLADAVIRECLAGA